MQMPTAHLISIDQLEGPQAERLNPAQVSAGRQVVRWAKDYLCKPHPELGRNGSVCPCVTAALLRRSFYLRIEDNPHPAPPEIDVLVAEMGDVFSNLEPTAKQDAQYKTLLILFPNLPPEHFDLLDGSQSRLKPDFVSRGYMVGQFHGRPPSNPGLWNPNFRPLVSDVPMLVIRHMVPSDLPFLLDEERFAIAWFDRFGHRATEAQRTMLRKAVPAATYAQFEIVWRGSGVRA
ncbi:hypothetical protein EAH87_16055 [Sphingomonas koreensis]|nr:hypothetical protein EAH87_16055 [Sphingomonas koreensis]